MQTMFLLDIGKHDVILSVSILIRNILTYLVNGNPSDWLHQYQLPCHVNNIYVLCFKVSMFQYVVRVCVKVSKSTTT